jgi:hypothetical protein
MKSNDQKLLEEAYISALQKSVNVPSDSASEHQPDAHLEPEVGTEPVVMSITAEEPHDEVCGCDDHHDEVDHMEEEHEESSMAKTNLYSIFKNAKMIHEYIESGVHLETWMLQKIAVVADNLNSVAKVAEYHAAKGSH